MAQIRPAFLVGSLLYVSGISIAPIVQSLSGPPASKKPASPPPPAKLAWLETSPGVTNATVGGLEASAVLVTFLKNEGDAPAIARISGFLRGKDGRLLEGLNITLLGDSVVAAGSMSAVPVRMQWRPGTWPVTGYLVLSDGKATLPAVSAWPLTVNMTPEDWSGRILLWALILSLVVIALSAVALWGHWPKDAKPATASWDYSKSWASNVNVAGALIQLFVVATAGLDQPLYMSKSAYSLTSILLGALVVLAPAVYNMLTTAADSTLKGIPFLVSCLLTIWGAFGQLFALGLMIREFLSAGMLEAMAARLFWGVLAATGVVICLYVMFSVRHVITASVAVEPPDSRALQRRTAIPSGTRWAVL